MGSPQKPPDDILNYIWDNFDYDPVEGLLYRLKALECWKVCGDTRGRTRVKIKTKRYFTYNICWYLYYGEWPYPQVDHKDRNPNNNKLENLRLSTHSENMLNMEYTKPYGYYGVYLQPGTKNYFYKFIINKLYYQKYGFKTAREAAKARELHLDQLGDTFCARNKDLG